MLVSSVTRRGLALPGRFHAIRSVSSSASIPPRKKEDNDKGQRSKLTRRQLHSSTPNSSQVMEAPVSTSTTTTRSSLVDRFVITAEVTISKIFPAGFGWQTASIVAAQQGFAGGSLQFALSTGLGDAIGVCVGHMTYYTAKQAFWKDSAGLNLTYELHTGILLGSAAFCSGMVWQPLVNALQGANLPFQQVFLGTWIGCGVAFYGGLRVPGGH